MCAFARRPGSLAATQMDSGRYDLIVFDEINYVISYGMLDVDRVVAGLPDGPKGCM